MILWRGRWISAGEFAACVRDTYERMCAAGLARRDTVAVLTEVNHPLSLAARYAAHLRGATVTHLGSTNPGTGVPLPPRAQSSILRECGAGLLVTDAANATAPSVLAGLLGAPVPSVVGELPAPGTDPGPAADLSLSAVVADCAVITYTSGSTGRPKGVRQSFAAWNDLVQRDARALAASGRPERLLVVTPTSHAVAVMADAVLCSGGSLVLHEGFDAAQTLAAVEDASVTRTYVATPQLYRLLDEPGLTARDLGSLRHLAYSGSPAAPSRIEAAVRAFGPVLVQVYGSTEAGRITVLDQLDHLEPELLDSVGRPFPGVGLRFRDPATGRPLPHGEIGEVLVNSPHAMQGYQDHHGPPGSAVAPADGWLPTGDLGYLDPYGCLHLVDRLHRVVKSAGVKIHPAQVEKALLLHPAVAECAVYAVRDDDLLEQVHAAVRLHRPCDPAVLRDHVAEVLSPEHAPVCITPWAELPLTETGKPDLRRIRSDGSGHRTPSPSEGRESTS